MAVSALAVCAVTRRRLGDDGLAELARCLWAVDCQSCGRLLGTDPPGLCVDELGSVAVASLHHRGCRAPGWNASMTVLAGSGQFTTFVARMVLLPVAWDGGADTWPLMVVNPGLECVQLERAQGGRWQVSQDQGLVRAGLGRLGPGLPLDVPADGLVARVTDSSVAVILQVPPFTVYEAPADQRLLDRARCLGGVLFAVTPTLNPGDLTVSELREALADPPTLAGWAGLHGTRHQRPRRRRFRLRSEIWVLHWNSWQLSVGSLVRLTPRGLAADRARSWAERVIDPGRGEPLTWQPVQGESPDEGWQAREPSSGRLYELRREANGWQLVLAYGQASGERAETDNEAKAWAAEVLRLQAGISGLTWRPGPSTPGSVTLYGIA